MVQTDRSMGAPPRRRVLYVEDEPAVQRLVEFWLVDAGYEVRLAGDGREGLQAVLSDRPDLVITDALMPNMTGDELVAVMAADPDLGDIPIIMATAAASPFRVKRMLARGCRSVLAKPLDEVSFLAAVAEALQGP
jgi:CheY-like chemotaxis protein